jgi:hypothetical protein
MSLTVTLNVFSGRPNPVWVVPEGGAAEFSDRVSKLTTTTNLKTPGVMEGLGYRGFTVRRNEENTVFNVHGGLVDPGHTSPSLIGEDREIEKWLLASAPKNTIPDAVTSHVSEAILRPISQSSIIGILVPRCPVCHAADAPVYNPAIWNTPAVQPHNNCYNYANNRITNTFAQPGRATGHMYTQLTACAGTGSVEAGAISDGLVTTPNFTTNLAAGHGWYVAVVLWPGVDYHWYRQDKVGCWSHKPGSTAARNTDNSGKSISDPKTADRGPYTIFCTYMITKSTVHIS